MRGHASVFRFLSYSSQAKKFEKKKEKKICHSFHRARDQPLSSILLIGGTVWRGRKAAPGRKNGWFIQPVIKNSYTSRRPGYYSQASINYRPECVSLSGLFIRGGHYTGRTEKGKGREGVGGRKGTRERKKKKRTISARGVRCAVGAKSRGKKVLGVATGKPKVTFELPFKVYEMSISLACIPLIRYVRASRPSWFNNY